MNEEKIRKCAEEICKIDTHWFYAETVAEVIAKYDDTPEPKPVSLVEACEDFIKAEEAFKHDAVEAIDRNEKFRLMKKALASEKRIAPFRDAVLDSAEKCANLHDSACKCHLCVAVRSLGTAEREVK